MKSLQFCAAIGTAVSMAACSGLTQMQDTIAKFDQGAHSAGTAQMSFFRQVQTAECNRNFYKTAFDFSTAQRNVITGKFPIEIFDVTGPPCTPQELTNAQLAIRQKLMDTIIIYADAIQTLANGTNNKDLSKNSQNLTTEIKGLAGKQGFTLRPDANVIEAALNTAVIGIAQMIVDHAKYKDIKSAASAVQLDLTTVVEALKAENLANAVGLASKAGSLGNEYQSSLLSAREQWGPASFIEIAQAHLTYQNIVVAPPNVKQLNDTLDALVAANGALARATEGGAIPEISDLISRAQQANALFSSFKQ